jgi:signal transduction histidine kinase
MALTRLRGPAGEDLLLATALAVAVQLEVWIWWVEAEQGARAPAAVFGLLMCVPLVVRRRRPLAALVAVVAVYVTWVAVAPPRGSLLPYLVLLVAVYSVAAHGSSRQAWAGLGLALGAEVFQVLRSTNDLADYAFVLAFLLGAWLAGRGMRIRQQRADELFARAVRAEVEREDRARAAVAEERSRIARELHDIISHSVSVMVVQAGAAEQVLDRDPVQVRASLQALQQTGRDARLELRRLLGVLRADDGRPPERGPQPTLAQLPALAEQLRAAGVDLRLSVEGRPRPLPPGLDLAAYRIAQEGLTNVLKHAGGGSASLVVRYGPDELEIEMLDGGGPGSATPPGGFGLTGMRERAELYGGRIDVGPRDEGGHRLHARLPIPGAGS